MDSNALWNLSYGLFVLTSKYDSKSNGCIINTVMQITDNPKRLAVAVNKNNYTHSFIEKSGFMNISIIDESANFDVFRHFGFQSGKNIEKIKDYPYISFSENSLPYLNKYVNSYISCNVLMSIDFDTHTMFICEISDCKIISERKSMTYEYYHKNVKPKNEKQDNEKAFRCKICGYIYKGDNLPDDFICPICKHGASDFEKI